METLQTDSKFADQNGEIIVLELGGHIDQSNSYRIEKIFEDIIDSGCFKVIVDFSKVSYMSSAGWGVFIGEIKRFRDRGGDIKLTNMNADLYEVYQMLEFYHILEDYPSVEAAAMAFKQDIDEIDFSKDVAEVPNVLTFNNKETVDESEKEEESVEEIDLEQLINGDQDTENVDPLSGTKSTMPERKMKEKSNVELSFLQQEVKLSDLPLQEKIKRVIAQNPLVGVWGIRKILRHKHFGQTKIGVIKLYKILRAMDLHTKAKRYRFYRSC